MRAALKLEALIKKLKDAGVSEELRTEVREFYSSLYKEAYGDGKQDCEEKQQNDEDERWR